MHFANRAVNIEGSPVRKLVKMIEDCMHDPSIISFGGGAPSLAPPKEAIEKTLERIKTEPKKSSSYGSSYGPASLRKLIADDLRKGGLNYPADQIAVTEGGQAAIFALFGGLFNPGDEVIVSDPSFLAYGEALKFLGLKPVYLPTSVETGFQPDQETLLKLVGPKTKGMIFATPDNPTGRILDDTACKLVADIAKDKNMWILSDIAYKEIIFEGKYYDQANYAPDNTIGLGSFSKVISLPGVRLGYIYGPKEAVDIAVKVKQQFSLCPNSWGMIAAEESYAYKDKYLKEEVIPSYKEKRDVMAAAVKKHLPEAKFALPRGAFYLFPNFTPYFEKIKKTDDEIWDDVFKKAKLALIPGIHFGPSGLNHLRLTYVTETPERIEEGVKRLEKFFSG